MDDLQGRFRRLDRVATPNLWNEAVARAVELEMAPRRTFFTPGFALIAMALLLAALGGTVAVGAWLNREVPLTEIVTYENGMIMANDGCGRLVSLDPTSGEVRERVAASSDCPFGDDTATLRPAWSSDGSRLAYLAAARTDFGVAEHAGVWLYEAATGETRQVTECSGHCDGVDISPDGSHVAYIVAQDFSTYALTVVAVDGGETYRVDLPGGRPGNAGAAFSPDGSQIALPMLGGKSGVYLVDVSGLEDGSVGSPTLLHGIVQADNLAWSPNGEWIAYTQTGGLGVDSDVRTQAGAISQPGTGIVVVRADGTEVRALATGLAGYGPGFPTWSSDSATVAYQSASSDNSPGVNTLELWTVAIDYGEPKRIYGTDSLYGYGPPAWSPDGEWITFGAAQDTVDGESGLVLLRADGSEVQFAPGMPDNPAWQPIPED